MMRAGRLAEDIRHYAAARRSALRLELLGGLCAMLALLCGLGATLLMIAPEDRALALASVAMLLALASIALLLSARARRRRPDPLSTSLREILADLAAVSAAARAADSPTRDSTVTEPPGSRS